MAGTHGNSTAEGALKLGIVSVMTDISHERTLGSVIYIMLVTIAVLWLIHAATTILPVELSRFGIYPRELDGLPGVLWAPLIHGSWPHLIANSFPLLVLGGLLLYGYPRVWPVSLLIIYFGSGLAVWVLGRSSYHIGASGVIYGLLFFLFFSGLFQRNLRSILLSLLVFFFYGGMVWGILPSRMNVSFESHLFGAISGVLAAYLAKPKTQKQAGY